jgi:hypothetical protein
LSVAPVKKFVPQPSKDDIYSETSIRFANDIRWKEYWMLKKTKEEKAILKPSSPSNRMFDDKENNSPTLIIDADPKPFEFPTIVPDQKGFGMNLKPSESNKSRAPKGTDQLEAFIADMETQLIQMTLDINNKYKPNARAKEIRDIIAKLQQVSEHQDHIIVPTNKTNSFTVMQTDDYKQKVLKHLLKERNLKREIYPSQGTSR